MSSIAEKLNLSAKYGAKAIVPGDNEEEQKLSEFRYWNRARCSNFCFEGIHRRVLVFQRSVGESFQSKSNYFEEKN